MHEIMRYGRRTHCFCSIKKIDWTIINNNKLKKKKEFFALSIKYDYIYKYACAIFAVILN